MRRSALPGLARVFLGFSLATAAQLAGCASLSSLPERTCGNGVVDAGESCDTFAAGGKTHCGAPGSAFACRFVCSRDVSKDQECPAGSGCGLDGLCRAAAALPLFEKPVDLDAQATRLQTGDFDSDDRVDLLVTGEADSLGRSSSSVLFFGKGGALAATVPIPGLLGAPAAGKITKGATDDLVFASIPGLSTLVSRADRTLQARGYPFFSIPPANPPVIPPPRLRVLAIDAVPTQVDGKFQGDELLTMLGTELQVSGSDSFLVTLDGDSSDPVAGLVGEPVVGHFLDQQTYACDQLVVAFAQASSFKVYVPCTARDKTTSQDNPVRLADKPLTIEVKLQGKEGETPLINGAALVFDLNADGFDDILIGAHTALAEDPEDPDNPTAALLFESVSFVAYGTGKGFLTGLPPKTAGSEDLKNLALPYPITYWSSDGKNPYAANKSLVPHPLAVGQLDGDQLPDFVTPYALIVSGNPTHDLLRPEKTYTFSLNSAGGPWREAVVSDFNQDGHFDFVAASGDQLSLDTYLGVGDGAFNASSVLLRGTPTGLHLGDFDGDRAPDVAFSEAGSHRSDLDDQGDSLAVLFGRRDGYPTTVIRMGRFARIDQIVPGSLGRLATDGIDDIGLLSLSEDQSTYSFSMALGASDRQLRAPLTLLTDPDPMTGQISSTLPLGFAVGDFADHNEGQGHDVAVASFVPKVQDAESKGDGPGGASSATDFYLWNVSFREDGSFARSVSQILPGLHLGTLDSFSGMRGQLLTGNLDKGQRDEMVLLTPSGADKPANKKNPASFAPDTAIVIGRVTGSVDGSDPALTLETTQAILPGIRVDGRGRALLTPINQDEWPDLIVMGSDGLSTVSLWAVWNNGQGAFNVDKPLPIPLPPLADGGVNDPLDLCLLGRTASQTSLAVRATGGLYRVVFTDQSASVQELVPAADLLAGSASLACGDLDGDGLVDLAEGTESQLRLHIGQAVSP